MSKTIENLLAEIQGEMQQLLEAYVRLSQNAEEAGFPRLARFIRAVRFSETVRSRLILNGMQEHARDDLDLFVCPHCGLVFIGGAPEQCPVDEIPGDRFEKVE